jgi:hypothetical protein
VRVDSKWNTARSFPLPPHPVCTFFCIKYTKFLVLNPSSLLNSDETADSVNCACKKQAYQLRPELSTARLTKCISCVPRALLHVCHTQTRSYSLNGPRSVPAARHGTPHTHTHARARARTCTETQPNV